MHCKETYKCAVELPLVAVTPTDRKLTNSQPAKEKSVQTEKLGWRH